MRLQGLSGPWRNTYGKNIFRREACFDLIGGTYIGMIVREIVIRIDDDLEVLDLRSKNTSHDNGEGNDEEPIPQNPQDEGFHTDSSRHRRLPRGTSLLKSVL